MHHVEHTTPYGFPDDNGTTATTGHFGTGSHTVQFVFYVEGSTTEIGRASVTVQEGSPSPPPVKTVSLTVTLFATRGGDERSQQQGRPLGVVAVGMALLWAIDAAEADTLKMGVVQVIDGVAVEETNNLANPVAPDDAGSGQHCWGHGRGLGDRSRRSRRRDDRYFF